MEEIIMDQIKGLIGPIAFSVLAVVFGALSVRYGSAWAQTISQSSFTAACVAFQVPAKS
jgi:hypothetical protein